MTLRDGCTTDKIVRYLGDIAHHLRAARRRWIRSIGGLSCRIPPDLYYRQRSRSIAAAPRLSVQSGIPISITSSTLQVFMNDGLCKLDADARMTEQARRRSSRYGAAGAAQLPTYAPSRTTLKMHVHLPDGEEGQAVPGHRPDEPARARSRRTPTWICAGRSALGRPS